MERRQELGFHGVGLGVPGGQINRGQSLAWTKAPPGLTAPIASATSTAQAEELIAALTLELSPAQIELLDRASE